MWSVTTPGHRRHAEVGATSIEYAFLAALIAVVVIASVQLIGQATQENLCSPTDGLANAGIENIDDCP